MGAGFHGTSPIIRSVPAPKNDVPVAIPSLQLQPCVERIHGAAREKVPDLFGSHHDIHAHGTARVQLRAGRIQWSRDLAEFTDYYIALLLRLLAHRKCG